MTLCSPRECSLSMIGLQLSVCENTLPATLTHTISSIEIASLPPPKTRLKPVYMCVTPLSRPNVGCISYRTLPFYTYTRAAYMYVSIHGCVHILSIRGTHFVLSAFFKYFDRHFVFGPSTPFFVCYTVTSTLPASPGGYRRIAAYRILASLPLVAAGDTVRSVAAAHHVDVCKVSADFVRLCATNSHRHKRGARRKCLNCGNL